MRADKTLLFFALESAQKVEQELIKCFRSSAKKVSIWNIIYSLPRKFFRRDMRPIPVDVVFHAESNAKRKSAKT
jgi:hypothetical protein